MNIFKRFLCALVVVCFLISCSSKKDLSVKNLFWTSKQVEISKIDESPIKEQITYTNTTEVTIKTDSTKKDEKVDLSKVQKLDEVTVTANQKISFVPVRNGKINIGFNLKVPKELISEDWRLILTPNIIIEDTTITLRPLFIKGNNFIEAQEKSYQAYEDYLNGIVPREKYDSAFFDNERAEFALNRIKNENYKDYKRRFTKQKKVKEWFGSQQQNYKDIRAKQKGKLAKRKAFYNILIKDRLRQEHNKGKDTTGLYVQYIEPVNRKFNKFKNESDSLEVPEKYKHLLYSDYPKNKIFSTQDSIYIASDYYKADKIIINEDKIDRKDEVKDILIPFAYAENYKIDTLANTTQDFLYLYKEDYPITRGLSKLSVFLTVKTDATDLSSYHFEETDTITYVVSSFSQLVNRDLKYRKKTVHKQGINTMIPNIVFEKDNRIIEGQADNKKELDKIIDSYIAFKDKGGYVIDSLTIHSFTSLSKDFNSNAENTLKRAENLRDYLKPKIETPIAINARGEDWQGLVNQIRTHNNIPHKEEILLLLSTAINPDETKLEIKKKYPKEWNLLQKDIFPKLDRIELSFDMHYPDIEDETAVIEEEKPNYDKALALIEKREYWEALQILKNYPDYNTALCLVALNYEDKAKEVLDQLAQTADNEYLLAIIAIRKKDNIGAMNHLKKSVSLDKSKLERIKLDSEVMDFCVANNFFDTLNI